MFYKIFKDLFNDTPLDREHRKIFHQIFNVLAFICLILFYNFATNMTSRVKNHTRVKFYHNRWNIVGATRLRQTDGNDEIIIG